MLAVFSIQEQAMPIIGIIAYYNEGASDIRGYIRGEFNNVLVSCQHDIVVYILYPCQQKSHDKIQGHFNKRRA